MDWTSDSFVYGALMALAVTAAMGLSRFTQSSLSLSTSEKLSLGFGGFCGAMLCAKLPFVLMNGSGLLSGIAWYSDGKTIVCGLVGGYFGVELTKWILGVQQKTGDSFAAPVALAIGIGRLACFRAGCCYGTPTTLPWGVVFPRVDDVPRHPTQLYEAAFHLTMALLLLHWQHRRRFPRQLIKLYIISYLVFRLATELIRPEPRLWSGLTGYQWACLLLIPVFVGLWIRDRTPRIA